MQEYCHVLSDHGIARDAATKLPAVNLITHPSRLWNLKSQLQIDRITFSWRGTEIVLGLAMMVVIYIVSMQLLSTFQTELKIKPSQGKILLRATNGIGVGSREGREIKCYSILIKFYASTKQWECTLFFAIFITVLSDTGMGWVDLGQLLGTHPATLPLPLLRRQAQKRKWKVLCVELKAGRPHLTALQGQLEAAVSSTGQPQPPPTKAIPAAHLCQSLDNNTQ